MKSGDGAAIAMLESLDEKKGKARLMGVTPIVPTRNLTKEVNRLRHDANDFIRRIVNERARIKELDEQIIKYQERILDQKRCPGGRNAQTTNNQLVARQVRVMDSQLENCLAKFNESVAKNKELRIIVDRHRKERIVFDGIYKKLERELFDRRREIAAILDDTKNAYQARDKTESELSALYQQVETERKAFEIEFKTLGEVIKHRQARLEAERQREVRELAKHEAVNSFRDPSFYNSTESEDGLDGGSVTSTSTLHIAAASNINGGAGGHVNSGNGYTGLSPEEIILRALDQTGVEDLEELITRFVEAEEQNFSLYNYVNDTNSEIESLEHSISSLRAQLERARGIGGSNSDTQRKRTVRALEEKMVSIDRSTEDYKTRSEASAATMQVLKGAIHSLFSRICSSSSNAGAPVDESLSNQHVTESNMMQFIGSIEQRATEILQSYASVISNSQSYDNGVRLQLPNINLPKKDVPPLVPPLVPSYAELNDHEGSDDDIDDRPLTRTELVRRSENEFSPKRGMLAL